jgi:hypothetical protein
MHLLPHLVRHAALAPIATALFLSAAPSAHAAVGTAVYATGLHINTGSIVAPDGRIWVSDHNAGFCRVKDATANGPGYIEHPDFDPNTPAGPDETPTCVGGLLAGAAAGPDASSAPAFYDPSPLLVGNGDERVYVPDGAAPSSDVFVLRWQPATHLFTWTDGDVVTMIGPRVRPLAASLGPDGFIYVGFQKAGNIQRFDPDSPSPAVASPTSDGRGVSAVAAGFDSAGKTTVYVAETAGLRQFHPGAGGGDQPTPFSVDAPAALTYDLDRHLLYSGTANGLTQADKGIDHVQRVATDANSVEEYATGFSMVGGLGVRPDGAVMVVDDEALLDPAEPIGTGLLYIAGLPASRITGGPGEFTNVSSPTFTVGGDQALQCSLVPAGADPVWVDCAGGTFTPAGALADGTYVFATRSVTPAGTGIPVARTFTVDTAAPGAPTIDAPGSGSTVSGAPQFAFSGEPGASFACSLDDGPFAACEPGATFAFDADAAHTLRIQAIDRAGNVSEPSAASAFTVDVSAPTVTIDSPGDNALTGRSPQFTYHASEGGVQYRCRLDNGPVTACAGSKGYTNVAAGTHTFQVGATDAVGNAGPMAGRRIRVGGDGSTVDDGAGERPGTDGTSRSLAGLRLGRLSLRVRVTRAQLGRSGLRVGFTPKAGTRVVRVRVYRLTARGTRRVVQTFVTVRGTASRKIALRQRAIRRLAAGRYRIELTPGTARTKLGPATTRTFRVVV